MPTYTFYNKRTKKEFTDLMSISEMEEYLSKNKHISQVIQPINIVAGVSGLTHKNDQGWKENMSRIGRHILLVHLPKDTVRNQSNKLKLNKH